MPLQELVILRLPQSTLQDVEIGASSLASMTIKGLESSGKKISVRDLGSNRFSVKWDEGVIGFDKNPKKLRGLIESTTILRGVFETAFSGNS